MSILLLSILPNELSLANRAANSPARFPKTKRSESEFPPSRFAPLMPAAHSPAANKLADIDITEQAMEVGPTTHYIMGGIHVDPDTQMSRVPGLFAAVRTAPPFFDFAYN